MKMKVWLCLVVLTLLAGCASSSPDGEGVVFHTDGKRILVLDYSAEPYLGMSWNDIFDQYEGSAIWLNANSSRYKVGDRIQYWIQGGVNNSYPSQGGARKVKKIGQAPSASPVSLSTEATPEQPDGKFRAKVELTYRQLDVAELTLGEAGSDWQPIQSMDFGQIANQEAIFHLFHTPASDDRAVDTINGLLQWGDKRYPLLDLLPHLEKETPDSCIGLCRMDQAVAGSKGVKLIGRIPLMATGAGLYRYLYIDGDGDTGIYSFDAWGRLQMADVNGDGIDEMLLVFEGLGNNFPDLFLLRWNGEAMEMSQSFLEGMSFGQGHLAKLNQLDDGSFMVRVYSLAKEDSIYWDYRMNDEGDWERQ